MAKKSKKKEKKEQKLKMRDNEINTKRDYRKDEYPENNEEIIDAAKGEVRSHKETEQNEKYEQKIILPKDKEGNPILPKVTDNELMKKTKKDYHPILADEGTNLDGILAEAYEDIDRIFGVNRD